MEQNFQYETCAFRINATLSQTALNIVLEDFIQWTIYSKQYSPGDEGKGQIHKKADIDQIYSCLLQIKKQHDLLSVQQKQESYENYQYGKMLKSNGVPCYKIERKGKIILFHIIVEKRTGIQITYQSSLSLNKIRQYTKPEIQIQKQKQKRKKKQRDEEFAKQIRLLKQQKTSLQELLKYTISQLQATQRQLILTKSDLQETIDEVLKIREQFKVFKQQIQIYKIDKFQQKINQLITKRQETDFKAQQPFYNKFKINGNHIQYIGENNCHTHYILNKAIPENTFKVKITKAEDPFYIFVGLLDYHRQKNQRASYNKNSLCYYRSSNGRGYKNPQGIQEGNGFGVGDVVQVVANFSQKNIKWLVNGTLQASYNHDLLGDPQITFLPFVQFFYTNSAVQWID